VRAKYLKGRPISLVENRHADYPHCSELIKIKDLYLENRKMEVGTRESTSSGMMLGAHHSL
jgi:hypothetical protein